MKIKINNLNQKTRSNINQNNYESGNAGEGVLRSWEY